MQGIPSRAAHIIFSTTANFARMLCWYLALALHSRSLPPTDLAAAVACSSPARGYTCRAWSALVLSMASVFESPRGHHGSVHRRGSTRWADSPSALLSQQLGRWQTHKTQLVFRLAPTICPSVVQPTVLEHLPGKSCDVDSILQLVRCAEDPSQQRGPQADRSARRASPATRGSS